MRIPFTKRYWLLTCCKDGVYFTTYTDDLPKTIIEFSRARVIITNHIRLTRSEYLDIKAIKAGIASDG